MITLVHIACSSVSSSEGQLYTTESQKCTPLNISVTVDMTSSQCHSYTHSAFIHAHLPTHFTTLLHNLMWPHVHCYRGTAQVVEPPGAPHTGTRGDTQQLHLSSLAHQATSITCHSCLALGLSSTTSTGWRGHTPWGGHLARSYTGREAMWHRAAVDGVIHI